MSERPPRLLRATLRVVLFAGVWWILTAGDVGSWVIGAPVVLVAAVASVTARPAAAWRIAPAGLVRFVPYFLWRSIVGSVDVARRALHPRLPIAPALETYALRLPADGPSRVVFADVVSLLPGTLSAELEGDVMTVHLLNSDSPRALDDLKRLESLVGGVFGRQLESPHV